jgi:hypothetical protein
VGKAYNFIHIAKEWELTKEMFRSVTANPCDMQLCRVFQKELYNFESLYALIQRICRVF